MEWLVNNWYLLVTFILVGVVIVVTVYHFLKLPTKQQLSCFKEWLKIAVFEAERELGRKTGQLKLRLVYDMAISKFSWLSFISFETFSDWVDEALKEVNKWLESNEDIKRVVNNE